jgi:rod shape-determining protein MreD
MNIKSNGMLIFISFFLALALLIIPLPKFLVFFRPQFALLVLIYWVLYLPERVGIATGFTVGLLLDVLHGGLLGQYALSFTIVSYLVYQLQARLRMFPIFQQMLSVLVFCGLVQVLAMWIYYFVGEPRAFLLQWLSVLTTALFWPVVAKLLDFSRDV